MDLPCGSCGANVKNAALEKTGSAAGRLFHIAALSSILLGGAAVGVAGGFLLSRLIPVAVVPLTVAAVMAESRFKKSAPEDRQFFWRFHSNWKAFFKKETPEIPVLEPKCMEPLIDAWYLDMDRLERLAFRGDWTLVGKGARQLSCIYRNPRLSRLQYRVLLHIPEGGRESFDLNEICANLKSGDIPDEEVEPFLGLISRAVCDGASLDQDNIKRLFPQLLERYLRKLASCAALNTLWGAMGEPLFQYCGGQMVKSINGIRGELPVGEEGRKIFFQRLLTEVTRRRRYFIVQGTWYPILLAVENTPGRDAAEAFVALEKCFFHREERQEPHNFFEKARRSGIYLLHPEQRKSMECILVHWVVDETGKPYASSEYDFLRDLAAESNRIWSPKERFPARENDEAPNSAERDEATKELSSILSSIVLHKDKGGEEA